MVNLYDNPRSKPNAPSGGRGWSKLTDMAMTKEERETCGMPMAICDDDAGPMYPYELRISLVDSSLDKLGLDADCEVGDIIDMRAFATVTSVSINKDGDGTTRRRIELQIEKMAVESELQEDTGVDA